MSLNRENMNESEDQQTSEIPKINISQKNPQLSVPALNLADIKRHASLQGSPRSQQGLAKSSSVRCLCSPTTHAGSFRCRHHRTLGLSRGGSVGSNLSLLGATKSGSS